MKMLVTAATALMLLAGPIAWSDDADARKRDRDWGKRHHHGWVKHRSRHYAHRPWRHRGHRHVVVGYSCYSSCGCWY